MDNGTGTKVNGGDISEDDGETTENRKTGGKIDNSTGYEQ